MIKPCSPKGFLATRNILDYTKGFDAFKGPGLHILLGQLKDLLIELKTNELRPELLNFYNHQLLLSDNKGVTRIIKAFISHLKKGMPVSQLFPVEFGEMGRGNVLFIKGYFDFFYPAWIVKNPDAISNRLTLSPLPDLIIGSYKYTEIQDVIESVIYLRQAAGRQNERTKTISAVDKTISYRATSKASVKAMGWLKPQNVSYVLIIGKGLYRIHQTTDYRYNAFMSFTRYFDIQTVMTKLSEPLTSTRTKKRIQVTQPVQTLSSLQLMYAGYSQNKFSQGGSLSFFLLNNNQSIAIVNEIKVIVHKTKKREPEKQPPKTAKVPEYQYLIELSPSAKEVIVTSETFKYSKGDMDKFTLEFESSKEGYDYEISVCISWFNIESGIMNQLTTPHEIVQFPKYVNKTARVHKI
jgi:hypothetical protein